VATANSSWPPADSRKSPGTRTSERHVGVVRAGRSDEQVRDSTTSQLLVREATQTLTLHERDPVSEAISLARSIDRRYLGGSSRVLGAPANECTTGRIVPTKRQLRSISCSGTRVSPRSPASARATRTTYRLVGQQRSTAVNERVEDASQERVVGNLLIERLALAHDGYRLARKLVDPTTKLLQFRGSSSLEERCHECQRHEAFEQAIES